MPPLLRDEDDSRAPGRIPRIWATGPASAGLRPDVLIAAAVAPASTWSDGNPGMGFSIEGGESNLTFGFKDYRAYEL